MRAGAPGVLPAGAKLMLAEGEGAKLNGAKASPR